MIGRLLLRAFGIRDEPDVPNEDWWSCPTCGHRHPTNGTLYLGRLVNRDDWLRSEYENDHLDTEGYVRQMESRSP